MTARQLVHACLLTSSLLILAACDSGRKAPPDVGVRVLHAAPSYGDLAFMREQRVEATLAFKNQAAFAFDADEYDFNVDLVGPAGARERVLSFSRELSPGTTYTVVLTEIGGLVQPIVVEKEPFGGGSNAEASAVHAAGSLGAVDVFLEPAGTDIAAAQPWGTLDLGDTLPPRVVSAGNYELTITAAGDPTTVLLASPQITWESGQSNLLAIVDSGNEGLAPLSIVSIGTNPRTIVDKSIGSEMRVINTMSDRNPIDVAVDGQFSPPLFSAVPFGTASDFQPIAPGTRELNVTPAGNPGASHVEREIPVPGGRRMTVLVTGTPGDGFAFESLDDNRVFPGFARLRLINGTTDFGGVDFFIIPPGTDIASTSPRVLVPSDTPIYALFEPGDYEVVLRENGTPSILTNRIPVTLAADSVQTLLAISAAGGSTAEIVLFE